MSLPAIKAAIPLGPEPFGTIPSMHGTQIDEGVMKGSEGVRLGMKGSGF